mgnify:CR=1 FL=1
MKATPAEILREYGPFTDSGSIGGVSFDGHNVWFASGDRLNALDPEDAGDATQGLDLIRKLCTEVGSSLLLVSHDLNIAKQLPRVVTLSELNRAGKREPQMNADERR